MTTDGEMFPPTPRVMYDRAPLIQVICQFRFPPILKIGSDPPADFQEKVRHTFPLLERTSNPFAALQAPPEALRAAAMSLGLGAQGWNFLSEDRRSWISLTTDTLSFTTHDYRLWDVFTDRLSVPFTSLVEIYRPSFFSRIGLRYQDVIQRSKLGLELVPWSELLRKELLGEIAVKQIEDHLQDAKRVLRLKTPSGGGFILLQHGLQLNPESVEPGYLIDFDFSAEPRTEVNHGWAILDDLHSQVGRAFRWCITDRLHDALGPCPL